MYSRITLQRGGHTYVSEARRHAQCITTIVTKDGVEVHREVDGPRTWLDVVFEAQSNLGYVLRHNL